MTTDLFLTRRQAVLGAAAGLSLTANVAVAAPRSRRADRVLVIALTTGTLAVHPAHRRLTGAPGRRFETVFGQTTFTEQLPIHAWLIDHPEGPIVVDTGETSRVAEPGYFPDPSIPSLIRFSVRPQDELAPALRDAGTDPATVRTAVLTHLHTDHTGGLRDLPNARFLVSRTELEREPLGSVPTQRPATYAPVAVDYLHGPVGPFPVSERVTRRGDVRLVPTPGHTLGHQSVVVDRGDHLIVLAGDASFDERQMLRGELAGICADLPLARQSLGLLRQLARRTRIIYLPTHDTESAQRLARGRATRAS